MTSYNKFEANVNLIAPSSDDYISNPEYFFYKSKKETFRGENLLNTLTSLNIDSKPFFSKEVRTKVKSESQIVQTKSAKPIINKSDDLKSNFSHNSHISEFSNVSNTQLIQMKKDLDSKEEMAETLNKLKKISMGEIKEYIPKKFKLVSKYKE